MLDGGKLNRRNKSGARGVYLDSKTGKWVAKLVFRGVTHRESLKTKKEAIFRREEMEKTFFAPAINKLKKSAVSRISSKNSKIENRQELRFRIIT